MAAIQAVHAGAAVQRVISGPSSQRVVAAAAVEHIVARPANERLGPIPAVQAFGGIRAELNGAVGLECPCLVCLAAGLIRECCQSHPGKSEGPAAPSDHSALVRIRPAERQIRELDASGQFDSVPNVAGCGEFEVLDCLARE